MAIEERIVNLLADADLNFIKYLVDNKLSLLQNMNAGDRMMVQLLTPVFKNMNIDVDVIMSFLKKNRPDIYSVVTRQWMYSQVEELKGKI